MKFIFFSVYSAIPLSYLFFMEFIFIPTDWLFHHSIAYSIIAFILILNINELLWYHRKILLVLYFLYVDRAFVEILLVFYYCWCNSCFLYYIKYWIEFLYFYFDRYYNSCYFITEIWLSYLINSPAMVNFSCKDIVR